MLPASTILVVTLLASVASVHCQDDPWLPRELGRFKLPHAGFVEVYQNSDEEGDYMDRLTLYISTFNAAALFIEDPVFKLHAPGKFMDFIDQWNEIMQQMGGEDASTALWPNYPVRLPKEMAGFDGILQTSGFIPPGKTRGQLEIYNEETRSGPWNIASADPKDYSYHWVVWKDVDGDGLLDAMVARFHSGLTGNTESQLVWMKNPGNLGADGSNWDNWEQNVLINEGPDVYLQFEKLEADGIVYDTFVTGELWTERIMLYYVEDAPGAWSDPANIQSVIIDEKPGVPFEAHFYDLNNDGKLEILASAIDESVEDAAGGRLLAYMQPDDFRTPNWELKVISAPFVATLPIVGNRMTPGKQRMFYPSQEYSEQTTEFGPMKPWILLSGDDDGNHYVVYPASEDRDDWTYERHLIVETGKATSGTMAVVDLDNDGFVEIIAAGYSAGEVYVFTYAPE
ncbi:hypothetical protein TCAL_12605 [Tigriopus californicus]|uniref:VCBS repeat-containing protein n=1 Tax=Tigriopus californicus TaxID=6832 RepID=A0A553PPP0_TIGCA|nr:uncharacterized protein LOC131882301 [Tigriopus californicus]TRY79643.1 hypothetical protein TCAL_12605 [Tigriopus californicus]|eukprot:TCALIF_12605-PA protein Name:"Protein of unknown function" AED:0.04 eAED:0.04 QI:193/1/1/1/0.77/0.8/10/57/454